LQTETILHVVLKGDITLVSREEKRAETSVTTRVCVGDVVVFQLVASNLATICLALNPVYISGLTYFFRGWNTAIQLGVQVPTPYQEFIREVLCPFSFPFPFSIILFSLFPAFSSSLHPFRFISHRRDSRSGLLKIS